jgi:hypothetical protein
MSYFTFKPEDIVNIKIRTYPKSVVTFCDDGNISGSVYLERPYLVDDITERSYQGYSEKLGGFVEKNGPFSGSIEIFEAAQGSVTYKSMARLYDYYASVFDPNVYSMKYGGVDPSSIRIVSIPQMYYETKILSGSLTATCPDAAGDVFEIFDNGRGGLYSGSLTGTLVGQVFYPEGVMVFTKTDLATGFGDESLDGSNWTIQFKGVHDIPTKIFKCRAPAGQLNASTNSSYYIVPTSGEYKNEKQIIMEPPTTYITQVGLFNEEYELIAVANLTQPIKKTLNQDIIFRIRVDF